MECSKYNKHLFLLNKTEKSIYDYYITLKKPKCPYCISSRNVIKIIHSMRSKSMINVSKFTKSFSIALSSDKMINYICNKCNNKF